MIKIYDLEKDGPEDFYRKINDRGDNKNVEGSVGEILDNVRKNGDDALRYYTEKFDGAVPANLEVSEAEIQEALKEMDERVLDVIKRAYENIFNFHLNEKENSWEFKRGSSKFGVRVLPVKRAGVYVPGGSAPLPSSVLMNVIPAKVAGVNEIIMCTPPGKNGRISPSILAAARISGANRIFKVGGAQAIAAMAYGTGTIPKVDKITGPGNIYVATAKSKVIGVCGIDMIAGPSEILIIADDSANPEFVACDMLSQAEHDPLAAAMLITVDRELAGKVVKLLDEKLQMLDRKDIAERSLENNGAIIIVKSEKEAAELADFIAPEHLELCVKEPELLSERISNAGAIFLGNWSPEPMGDYFCGANHVLPTGGTARFASPLGVWDFVKRTSIINYTKADFMEEASHAALFAGIEGLGAHKNSITIRLDNYNG
ncbi:MAG: histidinol dehydrogenase [Clostridiales bacterium]|jgi:histidinol dehydrogenase|nr:histidinol dehydrogenase [Clostridiales bacterium]